MHYIVSVRQMTMNEPDEPIVFETGEVSPEEVIRIINVLELDERVKDLIRNPAPSKWVGVIKG